MVYHAVMINTELGAVMTGSKLHLQGYSHAQQQRLAYIDFCLQYFGQVSRAGLLAQFGIGMASGTRDFSLYRELAPDNLVLKHETKLYYRTPHFTALCDIKPAQALAGLVNDYHYEADPKRNWCVDATRLLYPDSKILAALMRAIFQQKAIACHYVSLSSGATQRQLVPHALANNGHRWHVRAYDRRNGQFRDFVCSRFLAIDSLDDKVCEAELYGADEAWNKLLTLHLVAHPKLAHKRAIELDYGMQQGRLDLTIRAALAGYLAQEWRIDCSQGSKLDPRTYPLALVNLACLSAIPNHVLMPGVDL